MKTIFITGESGTIPMALQKIVSKSNEFRVINTQLEDCFLDHLKTHQSFKIRKPEIDFLNRNELLGDSWNSSGYWKDIWSQVDLIIHSGAFVGTDYCSSDPSLAIRTNIEGTQNIVDVCNTYEIPLIYLSTTAILDPKQYDVLHPMTESTPINPQTLYGISKYAGELIVKNTCKTKRLVVRPVFGFGDYPDDLHSALTKVIYVLYRNLTGKETDLTVLLDTLIAKSYTRVENIANCILNFSRLLATTNQDFDIYNIGENHTKSNDWVQLFDIIIYNFKIRNVKNHLSIKNFIDKIKFVPEKDYLHAHNMDDSKIKRLGFDFYKQKDYISIDHGISLTLDSIIKNIDQKPYWL